MDTSDIKEGFSKHACYNRATSLLNAGDDSLLRYVCLELRYCIEAITHDKLNVYKARLPSSLLDSWNASKAIKALLELEPDATEDAEWYFGREDTPGQPSSELIHLGTHRFFPGGRWLNKTYNKLGNHLHTPNRRQEKRPNNKRLRSDLENLLNTLEPVVQSSFDGTMSPTVEFDCFNCKKKVLTNEKALKTGSEVECLDEECGAIYLAHEQDDGKFKFRLKGAYFPCKECSDTIEIGYRSLKIGYQFSCTNCGQEYQISGYACSKIDPQ